MEITSASKITQHYNTVSQEKSISHSNNSFKSNLMNHQHARSIEASTNVKCDEELRSKVEELLLKKVISERKKVQVMIQVLNDIKNTIPHLAFYIHPRTPIRL